jgi:hypothetical protein
VKSISLKGTPETPTLLFDAEKGILEIKGRSISPNPIEFYKPLHESMEEYMATPAPVTRVLFEMEYFNTGSSRCMLTILRQLADMHKKGTQVIITWRYEEGDENMRDAGIDYQAIVSMPFLIEQMPAE